MAQAARTPQKESEHDSVIEVAAKIYSKNGIKAWTNPAQEKTKVGENATLT